MNADQKIENHVKNLIRLQEKDVHAVDFRGEQADGAGNIIIPATISLVSHFRVPLQVYRNILDWHNSREAKILEALEDKEAAEKYLEMLRITNSSLKLLIDCGV